MKDLTPHALGHDGLRWHVRARCHRDGEYKDFILSRCRDLRNEGAGGADLMAKAEAALALGGGLAEEQPLHQAAAVFRVLEGIGFSSHVFVTCQAAWRLCRNPMALLLPFIWLEWIKGREVPSTDDLIPETKMIDQVPAYAIDQFTRVGGQVARAFLVRNPALLAMMDSRRIHSASRARIVGDLIFLSEGGKVVNRPIWQTADRLRLPHRPLPAKFILGEKLRKP